jgi:hypothetical protein
MPSQARLTHDRAFKHRNPQEKQNYGTRETKLQYKKGLPKARKMCVVHRLTAHNETPSALSHVTETHWPLADGSGRLK